MIVSDYARMLAVAPGGWNRCICRWCRSGPLPLTSSARIIEKRLLEAEIAEALADFDADLDQAIDAWTFVPASVTEHIAAAADWQVHDGDPGDAWDVECYLREREVEEAVEVGRCCGCVPADQYSIADVWNGIAYCAECS